eukprot:4573454-Prymnesium_polylepis.1
MSVRRTARTACTARTATPTPHARVACGGPPCMDNHALMWPPMLDYGEPQASDFYPATIVAYKGNNRKYKFFIHFDDRFDDGSSAEAIGLPDDTIRVMTQSVSMCKCPSCEQAVDGGRQLPLAWELAKP